MFRVQFHEDPGYLEAELEGFWTLDELAAFDRAINHCITKYVARFPEFPMLSDSRDFAVQSVEVCDAFAACSTAGVERHSGCVAIVNKSALARMQTARITDKTRPRRFFDDMNEARAWVLEDARARAEARRRD